MGEPNFLNRTLFHGDNLPFLRGLNSESVHLIATDPPFNKGRDFHATPDSLASGAKFQDRWSWDDDVEGDWVDQITDDWPKVMNVINGSRESYGDDMGAFLCFMAVRLIEMRRVLRNDGSLYLHCDPTASHYLKALMDAIFGKPNFRSEIVWQRTSAHPSAKRWANTYDFLLFYTKRNSYIWNPMYQDSDENYVRTHYIYEDDRGRYRAADLTGAGVSSGPSGREWKGFNPTNMGRHWSNVPEKLDEMDAQGLIYWPAKRNGWPAKKVYWADTQRGRPVHSMWLDIPPINSQAKERLGYPTQKPLALYERIISASSNEGDIVLDPFAGCATTPVAAERLGRQWVGMDIWDKAHETVIGRLEKEGLAGPDGKTDRLLTFGQVHYVTAPPERTDEAEEAVPFLQVTERYKEPAGPKMSRQEMFEHLIRQYGQRCQGCDRAFDDPRYLQLDHNTPRADGGINHITNRVLLCGPCNMLKSNIYTLSGLRRENGKRGYMARG